MSKEKPHAPKPFNPLEKLRLAESIVRELLLSEAQSLPPGTPFIGAGIYVIYYRGKFKLYEPLARLNKEVLVHPIYVGQAIPPGGRKGGFETSTTAPALFGRLGQHANSIIQAENLDISDFACRFLVVDEFWISLAESLLIQNYKPLWNVVLDGFGNHNPGKGRREGKRSNWDMLHPGRTWAEHFPLSALSLEQISAKVQAHLSELPNSHPLI